MSRSNRKRNQNHNLSQNQNQSQNQSQNQNQNPNLRRSQCLARLEQSLRPNDEANHELNLNHANPSILLH